MYVKIIVVDPDPATGSGKGKKSGSWMNIPDHTGELTNNFFELKILQFFLRNWILDLGSFRFWFRDPEWKNSNSKDDSLQIIMQASCWLLIMIQANIIINAIVLKYQRLCS
jgi:hypothetical protein